MNILQALKAAIAANSLREFMIDFHVSEAWVQTVTQANGFKLV
jgi:hypothetical protein